MQMSDLPDANKIDPSAPNHDSVRIWNALAFAFQFGTVDGDHHKMWVIDQMARCLAGGDYVEMVKEYCIGEDGPETYAWEEGIAP